MSGTTDIRAKFIANAAKKSAHWRDDIAGCIEDDDSEGAAWATEKLEKLNRLTAEILNEVSRAGWWIDYGRADADIVIREFDSVKRGIALDGSKRIR